MMNEEFSPEEIALFEADAEEAERGYSVEYLRERVRGGGRPRQIDQEAAGGVVQFRISQSKLHQLDDRAKARSTTRSALLRSAVDRELLAA